MTFPLNCLTVSRRCLLVGIILALASGTLHSLLACVAAGAGVSDELTPLERKAAETIIPLLDFIEATPADAFKAIAREAGINVIYDRPAAGEAAVGMKLKNVSAARALYLVGQQTNVEITYAGEVVRCRVRPNQEEGGVVFKWQEIFAVKEPWQTPFLLAYRLPAGKVIQRIPPPCIPERGAFIRASSHIPRVCDDWTLVWQMETSCAGLA